LAVAASEARERIRWSLAIFVVAMLIRIVHVWQLSHSFLFELRMGDSRVYHLWARTIADGDWLGSEVFYQAPLYPYFLAVVYRALGDDVMIVRGVQITLGAAACVFILQAGWRYFSRPVGIAAGLILAVYAPAIYSDAMLQKSVLDIFFICLLLWVLSEMDPRPSGVQCGLLGVLLGGLILTRENALVFVVVLCIWILVDSRENSRRAAHATLILAGVALVLLPVAVRNWHVGGELHLTTAQFGHNFYIGNNAAADGSYKPLLFGRGEPLIERTDAIAVAETALGRSLTPGEVSSYYTEAALAYIRSNPGDWVSLMGRKVVLAFNAVEMVDTEGQYTHAESSLLLRAFGWVFHFGVLAPIAALGVIVTWPRRRRLVPLYLLFLSYVGTVLLFYVFWRYRLPFVPFLTLFAAAGLVGLRDFLHTHTSAHVAASAVVVVGVAVFCNWPVLDKRYMRSLTHTNVGNELVEADRIDAGMEHYREAIRLRADNANAAHNLGVLHAQRGDLALAIPLFRNAVRIAPRFARAHFNLARALYASGEHHAGIESQRRGLALEPNDADGFNALGEAYADQGQWSEALRAFERALEIDASRSDVRANRERARRAQPPDRAPPEPADPPATQPSRGADPS